ncbi:hypothetical protein PHMEG_00019604 [Phytophthora megakarya]|uniref:Uncharacterized protein n=1 Tax=Phytophthora megakarya TaxID=4795 RepID=A0A225VRH4_9STRA|nr:hypothetical protein PHMEG_00019604 [Phytophthora megakarya]
MNAITDAKAVLPYNIDETKIYLAHWREFGHISYDQLTVMERILSVKNVLRQVGHTLDWIEATTWNESDLRVAHMPFGDEHKISKRSNAWVKPTIVSTGPVAKLKLHDNCYVLATG